MPGVVPRSRAAGSALPVCANELTTIPHGEEFVGASGEAGKGVVPEHCRIAFDNLVGMTAEANGTSGIDPTGCALLKVHSPS